MIRNISIFLATFVAGALIAFAARAVLHKPHSVGAEHAAPERAPMVNNALTPASSTAKPGSTHPGHEMAAAPKPVTATPNPEHQGHAAGTPAAESAAKTVNTRCAICGMPVDPNVPTIEYQGKKIGFGCKLCEPKFKADPDKYGPIYLRNEVIKR